MRDIVSSDNQTLSTKLRHAIVQLGYECPIENVMTIDDAMHNLELESEQPNLVLIVLPDNEERCLASLKRLNNATSARILAVGPGTDPQMILAAVHVGADDYLVDSQDLFQQLAAYLARITSKRENAAPRGSFTAVASAGGGSGASIIAANLAVLMAKDRITCALLDFDLRSGDQAAMFDLKPRHTVAQLCNNIDGCDQNMLKQSLTLHDCGVQILAAPTRLADNRSLTSTGMSKIVRIARSIVDDVIVDCGNVADGGDLDFLRSAEKILLVFRADFLSLRRLKLILQEWDEAGIDRSVVQLVANSCGQSKMLPLAKMKSALRHDVTMSLPDDRKALNHSVDTGVPLLLEPQHSSFAKAISELAERVGLMQSSPQTHSETRRARSPILDRIANFFSGRVAPLFARVSQ